METMREAFAATSIALLDDDPRVAVVLADISLAYFATARRRHPDRVVNVGIREQLMISVAAGMALEGVRPIVHTLTPFLVERPYEQIKLDLGHQGVGAVLVGGGGSYDYAESGRTHQAPGDVAILAALPGMRIHVPGHPAEVEPLLRAAVAGDDLVYVRLTEQSNRASQPVVPGHMQVVRRGAAGTVVAVGPTLDAVLDAAEGLDVTVLYATTVRPFDVTGLRETLSVPDVVLVEPYLAGTSSAVVSEALVDVPHRLLALGVREQDLRTYGTAAEHEVLHGLDAAGIRRSLDSFFASTSMPRAELARRGAGGTPE
jgi:transketolase